MSKQALAEHHSPLMAVLQPVMLGQGFCSGSKVVDNSHREHETEGGGDPCKDWHGGVCLQQKSQLRREDQ